MPLLISGKIYNKAKSLHKLEGSCLKRKAGRTVYYKMKVFIASAELSPFTKLESLGDSVRNLSLALKNEGCDVEIAIPAYPQVLESIKDLSLVFDDDIGFADKRFELKIFKSKPWDVTLYLIQNSKLFSRKGIYGDEREEYKDNSERFVFFCHAVSALLNKTKNQPDILLANDWQTGLLMPFIREEKIKSRCGIFVIHNMIHGLIPPEKMDILGLPEAYYGTEGLEFYGNMSLLKAGIIYSDAIVTVSPTYAKEIQKPEYGAGLDGLMRSASY